MRYGVYRLSALLENPTLATKTREALLRFDCGYDACDVRSYLATRAEDDDRLGRCRTYLIVDLDAILARTPHVSIQAYFTIAQHALDVSELMGDASNADVVDYLLGSGARDGSAPATVPGYLIAQFAKDRSHRQSAKGFLQLAQTIIERASSLAGGMYIVLDCGSARLKDYYEELGFVCIDDRDEGGDAHVYQMFKLIGQGLDAGFLSEVETA
ncbi:MAG: hypothetical protein IKG21_12115 [Atopobiaceae bacterium]|nr:hypothetical protein [Atopobiaceae bacterium]